MRTTLNIDDEVLRDAKRLAVERGTTLTAVVQDSLRLAIARSREPEPTRTPLPTFRGGGRLMPGVDLDDSAGLRDLLDEGTPLQRLR